MTTETVASPTGLTAYVAAEIRAHLGRHSISKSALARRLGVDDTWVGKRLNERVEITLSDLERIAKACDVEPGRFLPHAGGVTTQSRSGLGEHVIATVGEARPVRPRPVRRRRPRRAVTQTRPLTPVAV